MKNEAVISKFLLKHLAGLRDIMNIKHFEVIMNFKDIGKSSMEIEVDYRYLYAQIDVNLRRINAYWKDGQKREILQVLAHELCHIVTMEMTDPFHMKGEDFKKITDKQTHFEERVTEHFSRIVTSYYLQKKGNRL